MVVKCKAFSELDAAIAYVKGKKNPNFEWDSVSTYEEMGITVYSIKSPEKWLNDYTSIHYIIPIKDNGQYVVLTVYPYRLDGNEDYDT